MAGGSFPSAEGGFPLPEDDSPRAGGAFPSREDSFPFVEGDLPFVKDKLPSAEGSLPFAKGSFPFAFARSPCAQGKAAIAFSRANFARVFAGNTGAHAVVAAFQRLTPREKSPTIWRVGTQTSHPLWHD